MLQRFPSILMKFLFISRFRKVHTVTSARGTAFRNASESSLDSTIERSHNTPLLAGYPKPKLSEAELEASLAHSSHPADGSKPEGSSVLGGNQELQAKPSVEEGAALNGDVDRSSIRSSGRLRTGILARTDVISFTVSIKQIAAVRQPLAFISPPSFSNILEPVSSQFAFQASSVYRVCARSRDW
jgi:hypothetical protein